MRRVFDRDGNVVMVPDDVPLNDLTRAPVLDHMPTEGAHVVVAVPAADGETPRVGLMEPRVIATTDEVLAMIVEHVNEARDGIVAGLVAEGVERDSKQQVQIDRLDGAEALLSQMATAQGDIIRLLQDHDLVIDDKTMKLSELVAAQGVTQSSMQSILTQLQTRKSVVPLPDVTVPASSLITVTAGERTFTRPCAGLLTTDQIVVTAKSMAVGYGIRGWSIPSNGNVTLRIQCPVLSVGGSDLVFAVTAFR